jgi:dihydrofolate reductase
MLLSLVLAVALGSAVARPPDGDDEKTLRSADVSPDAAGVLSYFRQRTIPESDRAAINALIEQLGSETFAVRERAATELVARGLPAIGPLRAALRSPDVEVARRAERCLLARLRPEGAVEALLRFLPAADDETVADEVRDALAAVAVRNGVADPALEQALEDASPLIRGAAGEALARNKSPLARRVMTDADPEARMRVIYTAVTIAKDKSAVGALINQLVDAPPNVAWQAEEALVRLAGDSAPETSLGPTDADRKASRDAWAAWWASAADKADLTRLDSVPRTLGHTLIVASDVRGAGRIYEVGRDKTVLWSIDNIMQPFDAVVIGKDRVLIAEYQTHQVSLRTFRGETIWSKHVLMPSGLQPLPKGGLLVVSRNQVIEWNDKQTEVFSHQRDRFDIAAGCKDSEGRYWIVTSSGECVRIGRPNEQEKSFRIGQRVVFGAIDPLPGGRVLVAHQGGVSEYTPDGVKGWATNVSGQPSSVQRLTNGNTLIAGQTDRAVLEVDRKGKVVWEFKPTDGMLVKKARRR